MSQAIVFGNPRSARAEFNTSALWMIVGAWSILPFAAVLIVPEDSMRTYFWATISVLGIFSFALYAVSFGLTEALLTGLVFITNSAFVDSAYLPRASFLGGNFFFSDYYLVVACCIVLLTRPRRNGELLAGYKKHFIVLGIVVLASTFLGLSRGAEAHYVLRELHPLVYYPLAILLGFQAFEDEGARSRIFATTTAIVIASCMATLWQLFLINRFQFMTYATSVFGLSEGETFNAQLIRPPSQWLFLVFLLSSVASYPLWKKNRILLVCVSALDTVCILLGYSRTMILAIAVGLLVLGLLKKRQPMLFLWSATKTAVILVILLFALRFAAKQAAPNYWEAFEGRILGSFSASPVDSEQPWILGSRFYEFEMAIEHIKEHPVLGLGLGMEYREILPFEFTQTEVRDNPDDATHFMHNVYTYVWMKWGFLGVLAAGWIVWRFLTRAWGLARMPGEQALAPRGVLVAFIGLAVANTVAPGFVASAATPTLVGLMAAFVEACHSSHGLPRSGTSTTAPNMDAGSSQLNFS